GFYEFLVANIQTETMEPVHSYYGDDFCVVEHDATGTVDGEFLGVPGHGKRITFRLLHVWEFRAGRMSRENVWLDGGSVVAQLTSDGGC
ncbi:MAG: ester cyclase, partial [Acidimicrobiales bacterium]